MAACVSVCVFIQSSNQRAPYWTTTTTPTPSLYQSIELLRTLIHTHTHTHQSSHRSTPWREKKNKNKNKKKRPSILFRLPSKWPPKKKNSQIKKNNFKKTTHPFSESSKKENISFESKIVARFFVVASGKIQRRPFGNLATSHSRGDDVDVVVVVVDEVASSKRKCPKKNEFERKKRSSVPDPVPVSVPVNRRGRVLKKENHRNETKKKQK